MQSAKTWDMVIEIIKHSHQHKSSKVRRYVDFDLLRSLKVKYDGNIGLPIYTGIWPK